MDALIVRGSMTRATLTFTNAVAAGKKDLGRLSVRGAITVSEISSTGNIGSITAESLNNSAIYAGIGTIANGGLLPLVGTDFSASANIASVSLHPRHKDIGFVSAVIAARGLGTLSLASINLNNGGTAFGVTTATLGRLTARDTSKKHNLISFKNITTQAQVAATIAANKLVLDNFNVTIVS